MSHAEWNTHSLLARAKWTKEEISRRGIATPAGNRLDLAIGILADLSDGLKAASAERPNELEDIRAAHRSAFEYYIIMRGLAWGRFRHSTVLHTRLEQMLGGQLLEPSDGVCSARDYQFELYVLALLTLAGCEVRLAEPPDLTIRLGFEWAGIAVKRVSSAQQVDKRIKRGAAQLLMPGAPGFGFVAINLDAFVRHMPPSFNEGERWRDLAHATSIIDRSVRRLGEKQHMLGILTFATTSAWRPGDTQNPELPTTAFRKFFLIDDDPRSPEMQQLMKNANAALEDALQII